MFSALSKRQRPFMKRCSTIRTTTPSGTIGDRFHWAGISTALLEQGKILWPLSAGASGAVVLPRYVTVANRTPELTGIMLQTVIALVLLRRHSGIYAGQPRKRGIRICLDSSRYRCGCSA